MKRERKEIRASSKAKVKLRTAIMRQLLLASPQGLGVWCLLILYSNMVLGLTYRPLHMYWNGSLCACALLFIWFHVSRICAFASINLAVCWRAGSVRGTEGAWGDDSKEIIFYFVCGIPLRYDSIIYEICISHTIIFFLSKGF